MVGHLRGPMGACRQVDGDSFSARRVTYSAIRIRPSGARLANALEPTCSVAGLAER
jgi:hypothetical protein